MLENTYSLKNRILKGLRESEFIKLGFSKNPFIPFIPKDILGTFVDRDKEMDLFIRYLPELINGFMPLLVLSGSKGIGKTHLLSFIRKQLEDVKNEIGHDILILDVDSFKEFYNKTKIGEIRTPHIILIDDAERVWDKYKIELVELIDKNSNIKFICVWTTAKWTHAKQDPFYSSLKPACIKIDKLTAEHLIKIINIRVNATIISGQDSPFTLESLNLLTKISDGIPYSMVYFAEKLLHYALDKNLRYINETVAQQFIENLKLKKFDISNLTRSQFRVLRILLDITNSQKRGATSSEVAEKLGITRPAVVLHLRSLLTKDLIEEKIEDKKKYYFIKPMIMGQIESYTSDEVSS